MSAPCGPGNRAPGAEGPLDPVEPVAIPIEENLPPEVVLALVEARRGRAVGAVVPQRGPGEPLPC